ncbi:MAG: zinc-binding dehydrogenase [Methyloceanibacter sp.]
MSAISARLRVKFLSSFIPTRKAKFILVSRRGEDLELLGRWADEGKLKPTISHVFPLDRAA